MKKTLIYALVIALILTGLTAIYATIFGSFSETQARIMVSTVSVFFYSIVGLCCNTLVGGRHTGIGHAGIIAAAIGLLVALVHTWSISNGSSFAEHLQLRGMLFFIGVAFAHGSLMLLIQPKNGIVSASVLTALACNVIFTLIVVTQIMSPESWRNADAGIIQLQIILCIVCVVTTITAPLINRFS